MGLKKTSTTLKDGISLADELNSTPNSDHFRDSCFVAVPTDMKEAKTKFWIEDVLGTILFTSSSATFVTGTGSKLNGKNNSLHSTHGPIH